MHHSNVAVGSNIAESTGARMERNRFSYGEQIAISLQRDHRQTFNECFGEFEFTPFGGRQVII